MVAAGDRFRQGEAGDGRGPHDRPGSGATSAPANVPGDVSRVMMNWLIPPALPENAIDRPRLTRQLTRPIVLITAPSGYGKTTLAQASPVASDALLATSILAQLLLAEVCIRDRNVGLHKVG